MTQGAGGRVITVVGVICLWGVVAGLAQRPAASTSPLRATGLLEIGAKGRARLVPIVIKVGDKFYDAGAYRANPSPLSLDEGIVYEATRSGESVGLFTVIQAQQVLGTWVGLGQWRVNAPDTPPDAKKPEAESKPIDADERPVLRRPKKDAPPAEPSVPAAEKPNPGKAAEDKPAEPVRPRQIALPSPDDDPSRPVLRRGKPTAASEDDGLPPMITEKPGAAHATPGQPAGAGVVEVLPAVSDAHGPNARGFTMKLNPEEQVRYDTAVRQMAFLTVQKFAAARPQHKPAPATALADVQFRAFDAHLNNEPDFVLSATLPEQVPGNGTSEFRYYVTVVARVDLYGELHQMWSMVTDTEHLDAYPRMELIDAVDAEGTGTGQLLFRQVHATEYDYVLFRIGSDRLWPLFEGGGRSF